MTLKNNLNNIIKERNKIKEFDKLAIEEEKRAALEVLKEKIMEIPVLNSGNKINKKSLENFKRLDQSMTFLTSIHEKEEPAAAKN